MVTASSSTMRADHANASSQRTILVAGGSYAGHEAVRVLRDMVPDTFRIVLMERNSHFNHVYVFPRYSVVEGHEHKAFIPYTNVFGVPGTSTKDDRARHQVIQGTLLTLQQPQTNAEEQGGVATYLDGQGVEARLPFDFVVYALGSTRPGSIDLWTDSYSGNKVDGISALQSLSADVRAARRIVIVGSGALGIEFAADIADHYRDAEAKEVVVLSSSPTLLPRLRREIHEKTYQWLTERNVKIHLGERLSSQSRNANGEIEVVTNKGNTIVADLVLDCTGLKPNTLPLQPLMGDGYVAGTAAPTNRYLQLTPSSTETPLSHVYVAGDAGHAFGAHKNGANARQQAGIVSRNICRQIALQGSRWADPTWCQDLLAREGEALEEYHPDPIKMKVSLGLQSSIVQREGGIAFNPDGGLPDMGVTKHWVLRGLSLEDMYA